MPAAIGHGSIDWTSIPDAPGATSSPSRTSSTRVEANRVDSTRFVEALQEFQRAPSKKIEREALPKDEPIEAEHLDDVELRRGSRRFPITDLGESKIAPEPVTLPPMATLLPSTSPPSAEKPTTEPSTDRARRLRTQDAKSKSPMTAAHNPTLPTTSKSMAAVRAAGSEALFEAVQNHVRVAVASEAQHKAKGRNDDEIVAALQAPAPQQLTDAVVAVNKTETFDLVASDQPPTGELAPTTSTVTTPSLEARENATLDHVQAILEDPASALFFDGRRAVMTIDGLTMRITTNSEGQASVDVTAVDAAAAERLQRHGADLADGLRQEGMQLSRLDVGHDHASSGDRQQRSDREPVDHDEERRPRTLSSSSAKPGADAPRRVDGTVIKA